LNLFNSAQYSILELFIRSKGTNRGTLTISDNTGFSETVQAGSEFRFVRLFLFKHQEYAVQCSHVEISLAYLCGSDRILDEGVCFLELGETLQQFSGSGLASVYDRPFREQYHFAPFKNWMNDPNGLCWYEGRYHLFYQANPLAQHWGNMYWGHAASRDLVHWVHLPIVLFPQKALRDESSLVGGAFSGSAVPLADKTFFFLTRHQGPPEGGAETQEWQVRVESRDMIHFSEEQTVIREKPEGVGCDFRDPKVFRKSGKWYLVLGANFCGNAAILLYSSKDLLHWTYENPLVVEPDPRVNMVECPDCFELNGKTVALAALMGLQDHGGRRQMTKYYIGDVHNNHLEAESTGWFDFGGNCYAVQTFEHEGKRIAAGWICDAYEEHVEVPNGANGSLTIPRVLRIEDSILKMEPVPEIYTLIRNTLYSGNSDQISLRKIEGNSYFARIHLAKDSDFKILLGKDGNKKIYLECRDGVTRIRTFGVKSEGVDFRSEEKPVRYMEIFVDRRTVEVFLNHGASVGTKIFYNNSILGIFDAKFKESHAVSNAEVFTMQSIW